MTEANPVSNSDEKLLQKDGLEVESEDASQIKQPFDPEKIKVRTIPALVEQVVSRIDYEEIDLAPEFQRIAGIWDTKRKSRLIESLLLRIPIPVFYVAADDTEKWSVVDGVQRISTFYDYVKGKFNLSQLEYLSKLNGCSFTELPRSMQRRVNETHLVVNVIEPGTPRAVMFNIFRRINTGGMALNGQEIRHALNPGQVRDFLRKLAQEDEFLRATGRSIRAERMADRECVLRFLAFHAESWERYSANDLDGFLSQAMAEINQMGPDDLLKYRLDFLKAMSAARRIFKNEAFRKLYARNGWRRPINKALFEAWSVGLARRTDDEIRALVENKNAVVDGFIDLMNKNLEFERAISASTGTPTRVRERFRAIDALIEECL